MKDLKKLASKKIEHVQLVKGGSNSLTGNTNPLLEDIDPALLDNILQDHR